MKIALKIEESLKVLANTKIITENNGMVCASNFETDAINEAIQNILMVFEGVRLLKLGTKLTPQILKEKHGIEPEEANMV